jgi:hypothetical protein
MKSSIRAALAVGALALSVSANASTYNIGDTYNAGPGGVDVSLGTIPYNAGNFTFGGAITALDLGSDSVTFDLAGSGGAATAYETTYTVLNASATGLSLWALNSGTMYDFVANGILMNAIPGNSAQWTVSSWLTAGSYLLRLEAPVGSTYAGSVSAVPLPAAAWLFGSALLGLGALRRKQKVGDNSEMALA